MLRNSQGSQRGQVGPRSRGHEPPKRNRLGLAPIRECRTPPPPWHHETTARTADHSPPHRVPRMRMVPTHVLPPPTDRAPPPILQHVLSQSRLRMSPRPATRERPMAPGRPHRTARTPDARHLTSPEPRTPARYAPTARPANGRPDQSWRKGNHRVRHHRRCDQRRLSTSSGACKLSDLSTPHAWSDAPLWSLTTAARSEL